MVSRHIVAYSGEFAKGENKIPTNEDDFPRFSERGLRNFALESDDDAEVERRLGFGGCPTHTGEQCDV